MTAGPHSRCADGPALQLGGHSRWVDLDGPVHYLDFGGPASGPVIVCVHGLGGSAENWSAIAPLLTGRYRLLAPDLAGHGLTRSAGRGTDVAANRALLHRFIETVPAGQAGLAGPVMLMGNSMGGMISLLEASAAPRAVSGLILVDPALPFVPAWPDPVVAALFALYATPGLGRVMMGLRSGESPEALVARILSLCCADASRVPADVVARHVEVARQRVAFGDSSRDFTAAMHSVMATAGYPRGHAYRREIRSVACPVLLLHGARDRLVPVAVAQAAARAHPSWSLVVLPGVGHVPQLEAPRDTARVITEWLGSAGLPGSGGLTAP
jgi:pimeloyl-ACP methyl ester carboxylesterase